MSEQARLAIQGMSCSHCVAAVRTALSTLPGVSASDVQIGSATVSYDPSITNAESIAEAVDKTGYSARLQPAT